MVKVKNCRKSEFIEIIAPKNVVGIGAGKDFAKFHKLYAGKTIIKCVVDSNKTGYITLDNKEIAVISFDEISKYVDSNSIIVLSSLLYADELLPILDKIKEFDGREVYVPQLLLDDRLFADLSNDEKEYIIPKKIHYCWFGGKEIPDEFKRYIDTWHQKCPDYEIIRWDESNYDITKNRYMYEAYKCKKWGFVPDYARLDIIYTQGGFYLDTDIELLKSLTPLRKNRFVCGYESEEYVSLGVGFGAVSGNEDILNMLKMYDDMGFVEENGDLNLVASPVYQTAYFKKLGLRCDGTYQQINGGIILPTNYLSPIDMFGNGEITEYSFSIHHYAGTWLTDKMQEERARKKRNRELLLSRCI